MKKQNIAKHICFAFETLIWLGTDNTSCFLNSVSKKTHSDAERQSELNSTIWCDAVRNDTNYGALINWRQDNSKKVQRPLRRRRHLAEQQKVCNDVGCFSWGGNLIKTGGQKAGKGKPDQPRFHPLHLKCRPRTVLLAPPLIGLFLRISPKRDGAPAFADRVLVHRSGQTITGGMHRMKITGNQNERSGIVSY